MAGWFISRLVRSWGSVGAVANAERAAAELRGHARRGDAIARRFSADALAPAYPEPGRARRIS